MATPHLDETSQFQTYSDQSPESGTVPFWVVACVRLLNPSPSRGSSTRAADKVLTVAHLLDADRIKVDDSETAEMNRGDVAAVAGYDPDRPDNAAWIVTFLQRIGYLRIQKRYEPGTGKRGADRFVVASRPPLNYVGPRTKNGLLRAIRMRKEWAWADLFASENPRSEPIPANTGVGVEPIPANTGVGVENPRSEPIPANTGVGVEPIPANTGVGVENPRSEPIPANTGTPRVRLSSAPSGRSGGERQEGESATPPADAAAGADALHDEMDWARQMVRELPWPRRIGRDHARQLAARFRVAADRYGYDRQEIWDYAVDRIKAAKQNPVSFVLGAFTDTMLDREPLTPSRQDEPAAQSMTESASTTWCGDCLPARSSTGSPQCSSSCANESSEPADPERARALLDEQRTATKRRQARRIGNL